MDTSNQSSSERRDFMKAGAAAFSTNLFTGRLRGANDRVTIGHIGAGTMGKGNIGYAARAGLQVVAVCDVYQPHLEQAAALVRKNGQQAREVKDFREVLADKSIDAVCISTPDHWHAYIMIEACKAGKDVYVEKPACNIIEEGLKMVEAARKYKRIVQGGTMQRSGYFFKKAKKIVQSGDLGDITHCHTWQAGMSKKEGWGKPTETTPPPGLDWDLWLGPTPKVPFNLNRWGIAPGRWSTFRYFWDYAGGAMTDWGVHLLDVVQYAFNEQMPLAITALGSKFYVDDNVDTPDSMMATYHFPTFVGSYESRTCNPLPYWGQSYGTSFHGTKATLVVNRGGYWLYPNEKGKDPLVVDDPDLRSMNHQHWENFLECIKTRKPPIAEIETTVRSTFTCLLANIALRAKCRVDWDDQKKTVLQAEAVPYTKAHYRAPWKLEV